MEPEDSDLVQVATDQLRDPKKGSGPVWKVTPTVLDDVTVSGVLMTGSSGTAYLADTKGNYGGPYTVPEGSQKYQFLAHSGQVKRELPADVLRFFPNCVSG